MTIKLDMSKAYNRIEWTFLESNIEKIRFWTEDNQFHHGMCMLGEVSSVDKWEAREDN